MTPDEWRITEIREIVDEFVNMKLDVFFALGKIQAVLTLSDDEVTAIIAAQRRLLSDFDQL